MNFSKKLKYVWCLSANGKLDETLKKSKRKQGKKNEVSRAFLASNTLFWEVESKGGSSISQENSQELTEPNDN